MWFSEYFPKMYLRKTNPFNTSVSGLPFKAQMCLFPIHWHPYKWPYYLPLWQGKLAWSGPMNHRLHPARLAQLQLVFSLGAASCEHRSDNNSPGLKAQTSAWVAAWPANEGRLGKLLTELFKEGEGPLVISQQPMKSMQMKMDPLAGPWELLH